MWRHWRRSQNFSPLSKVLQLLLLLLLLHLPPGDPDLKGIILGLKLFSKICLLHFLCQVCIKEPRTAEERTYQSDEDSGQRGHYNPLCFCLIDVNNSNDSRLKCWGRRWSSWVKRWSHEKDERLGKSQRKRCQRERRSRRRNPKSQERENSWRTQKARRRTKGGEESLKIRKVRLGEKVKREKVEMISHTWTTFDNQETENHEPKTI